MLNFLQGEGFAVPHSVGHHAESLAENDQAGIVGHIHIHESVAVSEYEIIHMAMLAHIASGESDKQIVVIQS